ncbi:MAG: tetratricopeptide repeat protein [Alphaproteobacteria bacterium]|nr:MAG: tetratricopeptide repeat protein [Alphaproteobacteria bacterium]
MAKILSNRIIPLSLALLLVACSSGPEKRATEDAGPVSVRARNALAGENPDGLVKVGEGFERAGDLSGALKLYMQAQAADPVLVSARRAIARVYVKLGRQDAGIAMLETLLAEFPADADVRRDLIQAQILVGQYERASELVTPIISANTPPPEFLDLAGRLAEVRGATMEARGYFDRALKAAPTYTAASRHLALSFALGGDYETAVALLQAGMDRADTQMEAQENLALVYALSGQLNAALHIARAIMPVDEARNMQFYYALLPKLDRRQKAEALMFNRVPTDVLKGLDGNAAK